MSDPVILRLVRPYDTVNEFLAAEARTINARGMLLVATEPLPVGTFVRFIVSLRSGEALIKAEGRVRGHLGPRGSFPGGLEVRFKRFGGATKQFIDRAVTYRASIPPSPANPEPAPDSSPASAPPALLEAELSSPETAPVPVAPFVTAEDDEAASGIRHRAVGEIDPPPDRDVLLDRLRERALKFTEAKIASFSKRARVG